MIEVELKFRIASVEEFERKLLSLGPCQFVGECRTTDTYFNHPARNFAVTDECLRLRVSDDISSLTWKGASTDSSAQVRKEIEFALQTAASSDAMDLLTALSFETVAAVCKTRRVFEYSFEDRAVQICLDQVDDLGEFVELELMSEQETRETLDCLKRLSCELSLIEIESKTYLELLLGERSG